MENQALSLAELNKLYLEQDSESKAITRIAVISSTISERLAAYKRKKHSFALKNPVRRSKTDWQEYRDKVWELTNQQPLQSLDNYNDRAFKGKHLDHKVSIKHGFKSGISPEEIAFIGNLRMIPYKDNMIKGTGSVIDDSNRYLESKLK